MDRTNAGEGLLLMSGQLAKIDDPDVALAFIDIFYGLGNQCRYGGQVRVSVLHHLVLCVMLAELYYPDQLLIAAYAGAHDVHETYLPDAIRPLKRRVPLLVELERPWEAHVHKQLGLAWPRTPEISAAVERIDSRAVAIETQVWGHSRWQRYAEAHGGRPTDRERAIGASVHALSPIRAYNLLRQVLPALPAGGG